MAAAVADAREPRIDVATLWLSWHALAVIGALLIYAVVTRLRRDRRPPVAAIAWVLALLLAPYLALPLYLLFGGRKHRPGRQMPAPPAPGHEHWTAAYARGFGLSGPAAGTVDFHADGAASLQGLIDLIGAARSTLEVATFVFAADGDGERVAAALIDRQRAGVQVRVLIDGAGLLLARRGIVARLRRAGVGVRVFQPPWSLRPGQARNLRNHRKWTIADGRRVWMGGRNLAAEYFSADHGGPPWTDLTFELEGPIVAVVARQFEADWQRADPHASEPAHVAASGLEAGGDLLFVPSGPDQAEDTVLALLIAASARAERRILAVTPYFVPDPGLLQALRLAALRGVAVDLLVPERSNHRIADLARSRALRSLADAGARIHLAPGMVHAKAIVFDDRLALAGSVNLDTRSLLLNYESMIVFQAAAPVAWLSGWIAAQTAAARRYVAVEPSFARDVGEGLLLALTFEV